MDGFQGSGGILAAVTGRGDARCPPDSAEEVGGSGPARPGALLAVGNTDCQLIAVSCGGRVAIARVYNPLTGLQDVARTSG